MMDAIRKGTLTGFEFDELKSLLNLQCGIDQSSKDELPSSTGGGAGVGVSSAPGGTSTTTAVAGAGHGAGGEGEGEQRERDSMIALGRNRRLYNEFLIELHAISSEDW